MSTARTAAIIRRRALVAAVLLACLAAAIMGSAASAAEAPRLTALDARPLGFEPANGVTSSVFVGRARGTALMISPTDVVGRLGAPLRRDGVARTLDRATGSLPRLRLVLAGAVAGRATTLDRLRGRAHHFTGTDPARWRTNVPRWGKVRFHEVYPGIDIVYYGAEGHLELDFVVAPRANPARIRLVLEGLDTDDVDVVPGGGVRVAFPSGEVRLRPPHAYQRIDGVTRVMDVDSVLDRAVDHPPQISLRLGPYDSAHPLVTDPVLASSSSFGLATDDAGLGVAVDGAGNTYLTGAADASASDPARGPTSPSPPSRAPRARRRDPRHRP
jgi:hypothetical protein